MEDCYALSGRVRANCFVQRAVLFENSPSPPPGYTQCYDISKTERVWVKVEKAGAQNYLHISVLPQEYDGTTWIDGVEQIKNTSSIGYSASIILQVSARTLVVLTSGRIASWSGCAIVIQDNTALIGDLYGLFSVYGGATFQPGVAVLSENTFAALFPSQGGSTMNSGSSAVIIQADGAKLKLTATASGFAGYSGMGNIHALDSEYLLWTLGGNGEIIYRVLRYTGSGLTALGSSANSVKTTSMMSSDYLRVLQLSDERLVFADCYGFIKMELINMSSGRILSSLGGYNFGQTSTSTIMGLAIKDRETFAAIYPANGIKNMVVKEFCISSDQIVDTGIGGRVDGAGATLKYLGADTYYVKSKESPGAEIQISKIGKLIKYAEDVIEGLTQTACTEEVSGRMYVADRPQYSMYGISENLLLQIKDDTVEEMKQEVKNNADTETTGTGDPA